MKTITTTSLKPSDIIEKTSRASSVKRIGFQKVRIFGVFVLVDRSVVVGCVAIIVTAIVYYLISFDAIATGVQLARKTDSNTPTFILYLRSAFAQNLTFSLISTFGVIFLICNKLLKWRRN